MATSSKICVMISSRCNDHFPEGDENPTLTEIRKELKQEIESVEIFGKRIFEVWINEESPPRGGTWDSWEVCIEAVKDCDILLVLSNGNAGWAGNSGDIGICHAEMMTGLSLASSKVWIISLGNIAIGESEQDQRNRRFQEYIVSQSLFRGGEVSNVEKLKQRVKEALREALVDLVHRGVRESSKGRFHSGQALDWNRLDFAARQKEMERVCKEAILKRQKSKEIDGNAIISIGGTEILFIPHAIPAALSVSAAKEMVGQPFLKDYMFASLITRKQGGPVHIIACHKTATEAQAIRFLGCPDATVVSAPFGIFVADNIQKIQFVFIMNCRDDANTRHGIQRFFEWLEQTREDILLAKRAKSRAKIVQSIAHENNL
ncbi:hypothetical protein [Pelosinus propionicus]|uniref:DUF4062 domain-containing protein n=1 Tax=Pelosinus propionicus DSM 13327 TaxID=1123291 RepID=A0A1I4Q737_9FIRM|nr:hypothetical protein [Pelosinus propionicus]SFM35864.1 hypothetical protein SAMN04490355_10869 [Pelosinus propionicus DSM 13327]